MSENAVARYQAVQIRTTNPGEILVALYDGLFKFLHVARHALRSGKRAQAGEAISRAYAIVSELYVALDHTQAPELCANLASLYDFCMARITYANRHSHAESLDDVIRVLTPVREAFTTVVRNLAAGQPKTAGAQGY